jgi:metallothiol transferase
MLQLNGIYEVAIRVRDLSRAEAFYCDVLGLASGLRQEERRWHFLWVGGAGGMVVLQEDAGEWPSQHLAFSVDAAELDRAARVLAERGVETNGPITHDWMKVRSLYFSDPDGHELELCAPLAAAS